MHHGTGIIHSGKNSLVRNYELKKSADVTHMDYNPRASVDGSVMPRKTPSNSIKQSEKHERSSGAIRGSFAPTPPSVEALSPTPEFPSSLDFHTNDTG
eukprot:TRINITY_DN16427_c0_g1_i1.p1 TRINITY_DN16427_c0_g1~~TRINITY_DN16427_c0_g1_i1.p1  ORF type:complete len:98 (+),score=10.47 TRINITY_DN16427_c0_g1_i1:78-371(+)